MLITSHAFNYASLIFIAAAFLGRYASRVCIQLLLLCINVYFIKIVRHNRRYSVFDIRFLIGGNHIKSDTTSDQANHIKVIIKTS